MELTRVERLILANQYAILEKLCPKEAEGYAYYREILENGYEAYYPSVLERVYEKTLSTAECREIGHIMDLHTALRIAYDRLKDKSGIDENDIKFMGFSGNDETEIRSHAQFLCDRGRFKEIVKKTVPDSHMPTMDCYRRMVLAWDEMNKKADKVFELSKAEIQKIAAARVHPSNRAKP